MKRFLIILIMIPALAGFGWLVYSKFRSKVAEETKLETEVAVRVGKIIRATLRGYVTAYGLVEPEPGGKPPASARIAPSLAGIVTAVNCTEGQRVKKGEILFQLDSRQADVAEKFAEKTLERQKKLLQIGSTSKKLLQDAEQQMATARVQETLLHIRSPLSGTVVRLNVKPGEAADLTSVLAEVIDLERLVVTASVPAFELGPLQTGQVVEVIWDKAAPAVRGSLSFIGPQVDTKTGTAPVRAALPPHSGLRPGQFVTLRIVSEEHKNCLAVPETSIIRNEGSAPTIALVENEKAIQKPVKLGLHDGTLVEIEAEGLQEGMPIVTEGAYGLPKETKIRVLGDQVPGRPLS